MSPTDPEKWMSIQNFKNVSNGIYSNYHSRNLELSQTLEKLRKTLKEENRAPYPIEIKQFASYNVGLFEKAMRLMKSETDKNPHNHKLQMSSLQQNKLAIEFIQMNENPDAFLMHNCYLPRENEFASVYESSDEESPKESPKKPEGLLLNLGLRKKKNSIVSLF